MLSLVAAAVLSQAVYTWVDASGVTHYTDDASKVPANVQAKQTTGDDISVIPAPPLPKLPPAPPAPPRQVPGPPEPEQQQQEYPPQPQTSLGYPLWYGSGYYGSNYWGGGWRGPGHAVSPAPVKVQAPAPRPPPSAPSAARPVMVAPRARH